MVFFTGIYQQINYQRNNQVRQPTAKMASEVGANQTSSRSLSFSSKSSSQPIRLSAGHRLGPHENIMVLWTSQSSITSLDSSWLFLHHKARDSNIVNVTTHMNLENPFKLGFESTSNAWETIMSKHWSTTAWWSDMFS